MRLSQKTKENAFAAVSSSSGTDNKYQLAFRSQDSFDTLESYTAENLPGPGRTLGKFTSFCGGKLEAWANTFAIKSGRTPAAVQDQLEEIGQKLSKRARPYGDYSQLCAEDLKLMEGLCREMLKWVR